MTKVERIKRMLENEEKIRERYSKEVTCDPALVEAEIKIKCFERVLRLFDPGVPET